MEELCVEVCVFKLVTCVCESVVCVCTICIDVFLLQGAAGEHCSQRPTKTLQCSCVNVPALYIHILSRPWAHMLGGTYILSLLVYMVNVYCDYTSLYYYI